MKLFNPITINNLELKNRLVMPPMCMYHVYNKDGHVTDFHRTHYHSRAVGGVGLIIMEATGVTPEGRITSEDLGIYSDDHVVGLKSVVDLVHAQGSKIAIQLSHAGRKSRSEDPVHYGPSAVRSYDYLDVPTEMTQEDIDRVIRAFKDGARRVKEAGFDALEVHGAHGYLIHEFISPISNKREDKYGQDKLLFLKEVIAAVKSEFDKTLILRVSGSEFHSDGYGIDDMIDHLHQIKDELDIIHVSSGGNVRPNLEIVVEPKYQVFLAKKIKDEIKLPTIAVGLLNSNEDILSVLENNEADLVACGRELLRDSNLYLRLAKSQNRDDLIPFSYKRAYQ